MPNKSVEPIKNPRAAFLIAHFKRYLPQKVKIKNYASF